MRSVVISVLVALILASAAYLLLRTGGGSDGGDITDAPLLAFQPSNVAAVIIEHPDGRRERLERAETGWSLTVHQSGDSHADSWPVESAQTRAALRVLHRLRPVSRAEAPPGDDGLTVRLSLSDGEARTLRLDGSAIGGRRIAQADDGPPVLIDEPVYEALTRPGPTGWRQTRALRIVGADVSRFHLATRDHELTIARTMNTWSLRRPVAAPADVAAVSRLLDGLADIAIEQFIDAPTEDDRRAAGLDDPEATLTVERDRRVVLPDGEVDVVTDRQTVRIGGRGDLAGGRRYASIDDHAFLVLLNTETLDALRIEPASLVSRRTLAASAARIGRIDAAGPTMGSLTLERTIDGWTVSGLDTAPSAAADLARRWIALLTERIAQGVILGQAPDEPAARITVWDLDGASLAELTISETEDGGVRIHTAGGVARSYPDVSLSELLGAGAIVEHPLATPTK